MYFQFCENIVWRRISGRGDIKLKQVYMNSWDPTTGGRHVKTAVTGVFGNGTVGAHSLAGGPLAIQSSVFMHPSRATLPGKAGHGTGPVDQEDLTTYFKVPPIPFSHTARMALQSCQDGFKYYIHDRITGCCFALLIKILWFPKTPLKSCVLVSKSNSFRVNFAEKF